MSISFRVVAFDFDGTLLRGNSLEGGRFRYSWRELWEFLDLAPVTHREFMRKYQDGHWTYSEWCHAAVDKFRSVGLTLTHIRECLEKAGLAFTVNADKTLRYLKSQGVQLIIVSGGMRQFIDEAFDLHKGRTGEDLKQYFDQIYSNNLLFENNILSGVDPTPYDFEGKAEAIRNYCQSIGCSIKESVFVGEGCNDVDAIRHAGLSIAYPPVDADIDTLADRTFAKDDLWQIVEFIEESEPKSSISDPSPQKKEPPMHDLARLRQLLVDRVDEDQLKNICFDNFRSLHNSLGSSVPHGKRARRLVEYADQQSEMDKLVGALKAANLSAYETYLREIGMEQRLTESVGQNLQPTPAEGENRGQEPEPAATIPDSCDLLVVTANPSEKDELQLNEEADIIRKTIASAKPRRTVGVHSEHSTSINELRRALHQFSPRIVHFSGHGDDNGNLVFESDAGEEQRVRPEDLANLFREFSSVETVMLNACYSSDAAEELADHVECVVGMGNRIDDEAAREFALAFYEGLAYGKDYAAAFRLGCNAIQLNRLPDADIPMAFFPGMETDNADTLGQTSSITARTHRSAPADSSATEENREGKAVSVKLWYGTIRQANINQQPERGYGNERDDKINYGTCEASVPRHRAVGSIGSWAWYRWLTRNDDRVTLDRRTITPLEAASHWSSLQQAVADLEDDKKHALVFVHGYNVSFKDAARRTAQIAVDLPLDGPASFFSWPSRGHLMGYWADEATIQYAEKYLVEYLTSFVQRSGAERIHLVAHSMGNRGLLHAIENVVEKVNREKPFDQVFLAAPDVDVDVFGQKAQIYEAAAKQVTLYASRRDRAVWASKLVHLENRVGYYRRSDPPRVFDGIDTVHIKSAFDLFDLGHGYVASEDKVLSDMNQAIRHGASPKDRRLAAKEYVGKTYWEIDVD